MSSDSCVRCPSLRAIAVMFQVISVLRFSSKNTFVTRYLLESSLAQFKNFMCCFQTISCLLSFKEGNKWISSAAYLQHFLPNEAENKKFTNVSTWNISELVALKLVMSWLKKVPKYCCRHCGTCGNRNNFVKFSQSLRELIHQCRI